MVAPEWHHRLTLKAVLSTALASNDQDDRTEDISTDFWNNNLTFNISDSDVIVFLHIQKTGGTTFGRHLVQNLSLKQPCNCQGGKKQNASNRNKKGKLKKRSKLRCQCHRPNSTDIWLFSRYSTGWKCGLHADYTELMECLPHYFRKFDNNRSHKISNRRYHFITELRNPINRYLSEYQHVTRGATWKKSRHKCNGRLPTVKELPPCYNGSNWNYVTLKDFIACKYNLANNRQTRMLADLRLVNCYENSSMSLQQRNRILLNSAKFNLKRMAYFGLIEYQRENQVMFEHRFGLKFIQPFMQYDFNQTYASEVLYKLSPEIIHKIREINSMDIQLYNYALKLFKRRWNSLKAIINATR
ncbi:uncharacterized protein TRIADDRAFT_19920 [Trichoplax adhaerens]|uniref:Heparan-sulfate 6-O-sulfotransferase n=1 Tax=Trichoplax adhaerens TaxID=10228 RepID=B3RM31_TRIAD|nr:hypothetical protein TRIADDRAFT_19920 [Trichoplax adhaerens]EDV29628.1 hypothetical protein TRIADDRAFT_19920 [Trichoplax adhaerens]|eukprot:XP_002108830.1 hypothetical protein TRIADDRAFT_19920 [Trichoplax adhaerens]